ncbi:hypothetical protein GALMADRAFT_154600 [Galerina marginata CBS 339.88]|uniref:Uncharacterized protein n=1 Tax=Galerina marginata (strain CBS 339.88) TaxID=685588 RepID=A0A067T615_GALM3|nr:hypothetical protein GALMADRAFT_154600 [Galerina marginata CBS 339.88]
MALLLQVNHWKKQWKISEEASEDQKRLADVFEADCEHLQEKVRALRAKLRKKREQLKNTEAALGDYDDIVRHLEEKVEKVASHLQFQAPAPPRNEGKLTADEGREDASEEIEV